MYEASPDAWSVTGIVLAGGMGVRLREVVSDRPKVLAEVFGRPFLIYLLEQIALAGLTHVVLCTGYMADFVRETLGDNYKTLGLVYSREESPMGTGGALRLGIDHCRAETVLVLNGDSFINVDLRKFIDWFVAGKREAALILTWVSDTSRFGMVRATDDGLVTAFEEKSAAQGPGWINAGVYLFQKKLLLSALPCAPFSLERDFFPGLAGRKLYAYRRHADFIDIGTPESYRSARRFGALTRMFDQQHFNSFQ